MIKALKVLTFLLLLCPITIWALEFPMPPKHNRMVGEIQTVTLKEGDTYTSIGQHFDVGYYELVEANPDVDPDNPKPGTILIIPTQYILPPWLKNSIVINLAEMRLYYASDELKKVFTFPIGIGREDWETPTGYFKIVEKIKDPTWRVPKSIFQYRIEQNDKVPKVVPPGDDNPLGEYALRLSDQYYLIHGTNDPLGIGRRSSAGCIRMFNKDIETLFNMIHVGVRVFIVNKPYKITSVDNKIYLEAHMPLYEYRYKMEGNYNPIIAEIKNYADNNFQHIDWNQVIQLTQEHIGIPQKIKLSENITIPPKPRLQHAKIDMKPWQDGILKALLHK